MTKQKIKRPSKIINSPYRYLIIGFAILAIILVIIILYFALSQANITITPAYTEQKVGFVVQVVDQSKVASILGPQRLNGLLKETNKETVQEFPAEQKEASSLKAAGQITVFNDYSQPQPLIIKTRFQSPNGQIYRLLEGITVPAKGKLTVRVEADQLGAESEIGPTKFILPALSQWRRKYVYAESAEPLERATSTQFIITKEIIEQATQSLRNQLINEAKAEFSQNLNTNQSILENSLVMETLKYSVSEKVGNQKPTFVVSLALGIKAIIADPNQLQQQAVESLPDLYKKPGTLTKIDPQSFTYEVTYLDENSENLLAQIKGEYTLAVAIINLDKSQLKGLTKKQAEIYLKNLSGIEKVNIHLPFWTKYLPTLEDHIDIQIKQ